MKCEQEMSPKKKMRCNANTSPENVKVNPKTPVIEKVQVLR